jgi:methionyl-tRNA synthetase
MLQRVEPRQVRAMIEASREGGPSGGSTRIVVEEGGMFQDSDEPLTREPLAAECTIEDFARVDLRVARVVAAESVPEARKLLKLTLSLGGTTRKTVFAGIKEAYRPEDLLGRLVICVANLAPRQMKFGSSEGMVVAAGSGGNQVFLLGVDSGAVPGERVH